MPGTLELFGGNLGLLVNKLLLTDTTTTIINVKMGKSNFMERTRILIGGHGQSYG
jgi:hypothetical protein